MTKKEKLTWDKYLNKIAMQPLRGFDPRLEGPPTVSADDLAKIVQKPENEPSDKGGK